MHSYFLGYPDYLVLARFAADQFLRDAERWPMSCMPCAEHGSGVLLDKVSGFGLGLENPISGKLGLDSGAAAHCECALPVQDLLISHHLQQSPAGPNISAQWSSFSRHSKATSCVD